MYDERYGPPGDTGVNSGLSHGWVPGSSGCGCLGSCDLSIRTEACYGGVCQGSILSLHRGHSWENVGVVDRRMAVWFGSGWKGVILG